MRNTNGRIGLGLVGLGKIARDQHIPALAASPDFCLLATASPDDWLDGAASYQRLEDMLADRPDITAVALCTPPGVRSQLARQALKAGRHVLLEKPPAATVAEAAELRDLAAHAHCALLASWHSRESECVDLAREWLAGKTVSHASVEWREDIRRWHPGQNWILEAGGFGVFDPGINAISILTGLLPGSFDCAAAELAIPANCGAPIAATLELVLGGKAKVDLRLDFRNRGAQVWDICIATDQGELVLSEGGHRLMIDGNTVCVSQNREYPRLYDRFARLIETRSIDADLRPLEIVTDALTRGRVVATDSFEF